MERGGGRLAGQYRSEHMQTHMAECYTIVVQVMKGGEDVARESTMLINGTSCLPVQTKSKDTLS